MDRSELLKGNCKFHETLIHGSARLSTGAYINDNNKYFVNTRMGKALTHCFCTHQYIAKDNCVVCNQGTTIRQKGRFNSGETVDLVLVS